MVTKTHFPAHTQTHFLQFYVQITDLKLKANAILPTVFVRLLVGEKDFCLSSLYRYTKSK